ncbi:transglycosylase domain-containing protein, partial [Yaniella sp.]
MGQIVLFVGLSVLVGIVAAVTVLPALTAVGDASSAGVELLEENPAEFRQEALSEPSTFYASDGETELAQFYAENREPVGVDDISQSMQDAIVSIEDERFYEHDGTDP